MEDIDKCVCTKGKKETNLKTTGLIIINQRKDFYICQVLITHITISLTDSGFLKWS